MRALRATVNSIKKKVMIHVLSDHCNFTVRLQKKCKAFKEYQEVLDKEIPHLQQDLEEFCKLKSLTCDFTSPYSIDYRSFEFSILLDFADGYLEGLLEISKIHQESKEALPQLVSNFSTIELHDSAEGSEQV